MSPSKKKQKTGHAATKGKKAAVGPTSKGKEILPFLPNDDFAQSMMMCAQLDIVGPKGDKGNVRYVVLEAGKLSKEKETLLKEGMTLYANEEQGTTMTDEYYKIMCLLGAVALPEWALKKKDGSTVKVDECFFQAKLCSKTALITEFKFKDDGSKEVAIILKAIQWPAGLRKKMGLKKNDEIEIDKQKVTDAVNILGKICMLAMMLTHYKVAPYYDEFDKEVVNSMKKVRDWVLGKGKGARDKVRDLRNKMHQDLLKALEARKAAENAEVVSAHMGIVAEMFRSHKDEGATISKFLELGKPILDKKYGKQQHTELYKSLSQMYNEHEIKVSGDETKASGDEESAVIEDGSSGDASTN